MRVFKILPENSIAQNEGKPKMKQCKKFLTKEDLAYFLLLNAGLLLLAAGIHFFKSPNHFAMGGTSGISILAATLLPHMDVGTFMFIINAVLVALGLVFWA